MRNDFYFRKTESLRRAEHAVVQRLINLLGPKESNEADLREILWDFVAVAERLDKPPTKETVSDLISEVVAKSASSYDCILPNQVIRFADGINSITIGPVAAEIGIETAKPLAAHRLAPTVTVAEKFSLSFANGMAIQVAPICWRLSVRAASSNVSEEALWSIDVALSLLRLSHGKAKAYFPLIGEIEGHPTQIRSWKSELLKLHEDGISAGGTRVLGHYVIDEETSDAVRALCGKWGAFLFEAKSGTVAQRLHDGLGWMSRGRRSSDRSERLLFFFTALESLLSSTNKNAPVTQTIARHAATILSDEPRERMKDFNLVSDLYEKRSTLVHQGQRNVSFSSANTIQLIVENVYHRVLRKIEPGQSLADFHASLARSGFGSPWPDLKMD
jgi:hypothetical protein